MARLLRQGFCCTKVLVSDSWMGKPEREFSPPLDDSRAPDSERQGRLLRLV